MKRGRVNLGGGVDVVSGIGKWKEGEKVMGNGRVRRKRE